MPFKMIANRLLYRPDEAKEYKKGEPFTVETEADMNRLLRSRRAKMDDMKNTSIKTMKPPAVEARTPPVIAKVMKAEDPAPAATPPVSAPVQETEPSTPAASEPVPAQEAAPAAEPTPNTTSRSNRYRRSDVRAED